MGLVYCYQMLDALGDSFGQPAERLTTELIEAVVGLTVLLKQQGKQSSTPTPQ
jgi:hypothetical protein